MRVLRSWLLISSTFRYNINIKLFFSFIFVTAVTLLLDVVLSGIIFALYILSWCFNDICFFYTFIVILMLFLDL